VRQLSKCEFEIDRNNGKLPIEMPPPDVSKFEQFVKEQCVTSNDAVWGGKKVVSIEKFEMEEVATTDLRRDRKSDSRKDDRIKGDDKCPNRECNGETGRKGLPEPAAEEMTHSVSNPPVMILTGLRRGQGGDN
jgi:hypothetical protein